MKKLLAIAIFCLVSISGCKSSDVSIEQMSVSFNEAPILKLKSCNTYDEGVFRVITKLNSGLETSNFAFRQDNDLFGVVNGATVQLKLKDRKIEYLGVPDEEGLPRIDDKYYTIYNPYKPSHLRVEKIISENENSQNSSNEGQTIYIDDEEFYNEGELQNVTVDGETKSVKDWEKIGKELSYFGKEIPGDKMSEYILYQGYLQQKEKEDELNKEDYKIKDSSVEDDGEMIVIGG